MSRKIKAYYVNPRTNTAEPREIETTLDTYYKLLECDCITITSRGFGRSRKRFDIICDDEGLLKDDPLISAIDDLGRVMLVGALLVCGEVDDEGELTSLTDSDVRLLKKYTNHLGTRNHPKGWYMLTSVKY